MLRKTTKFATCIVAGIALMCSCGAPTKLIKIKQESSDSYTDKSLSRFIVQNPKASVVVRDPNATSGGASTSERSNLLCNLIERGLMQKGYNPRDRKVFESVVAKMGDNSDYEAIYEKTKTDLIFEVTQFELDDYRVKDYYHNGSKTPLNKIDKKLSAITFTGFSIEIKVILLLDNLIGGTYKYYYTPCATSDGGCEITSYNKKNETLYYRLPKSDKEEAIDGGQDPESSRKETRNEKWKKQLGEFISNVVIPSMFEEMGAQNK
ncbi:MAG: hypothetical protein LBJ57_01085 [Prevotellaceae bacterium]|jgi:hypothetical protein|nr:hypothetical protein [Prevotellaceae bacterium]